VLKQINEHSTHDSEAANFAVTKMKKRACETMELTPNIINEWVSGLSHAGKGALTANGALKKQIRRTRREI
ncbi:FLYWCH-type domain-containing protein, partial [Aphis craccivora]